MTLSSTSMSINNEIIIKPIFNQNHIQHIKKKRKNSNNKTSSFPDIINKLIERVSIATLSHPFLLLSVTMITNTSYHGSNWLFSYFKLIRNNGNYILLYIFFYLF